jgi:hypothetical protein
MYVHYTRVQGLCQSRLHRADRAITYYYYYYYYCYYLLFIP